MDNVKLTEELNSAYQHIDVLNQKVSKLENIVNVLAKMNGLHFEIEKVIIVKENYLE